MFLKVAVLNNSGNVGKSTICQTLLNPRLEDSKIISIETLNSDGTDNEKLSAKEFDEVMSKIDDVDCAIIDIGASNIETFLVKMNAYKGSSDLIDFYLIPVLPQQKQQVDSLVTVENLLNAGVDKENIKFIFNMANKEKTLEKQYSLIFDNDLGKQILSNTEIPSVVYESDLFGVLTKNKKRYFDVYNDDRDFKKLMREVDSREERAELSTARSLKMLMNGFNSELDMAFLNLEIA